MQDTFLGQNTLFQQSRVFFGLLRHSRYVASLQLGFCLPSGLQGEESKCQQYDLIVCAKGIFKKVNLLQTWNFHGITEMVGMGGTLKIIKFHAPCHRQECLPLDQVAQSPIQPGLEHCQGGGIHDFSGLRVPAPHHPQSEEFLPYSQYKSTLFLFKTIIPCPITTCPTKSLSLSFF